MKLEALNKTLEWLKAEREDFEDEDIKGRENDEEEEKREKERNSIVRDEREKALGEKSHSHFYNYCYPEVVAANGTLINWGVSDPIQAEMWFRYFRQYDPRWQLGDLGVDKYLAGSSVGEMEVGAKQAYSYLVDLFNGHPEPGTTSSSSSSSSSLDGDKGREREPLALEKGYVSTDFLDHSDTISAGFASFLNIQEAQYRKKHLRPFVDVDLSSLDVKLVGFGPYLKKFNFPNPILRSLLAPWHDLPRLTGSWAFHSCLAYIPFLYNLFYDMPGQSVGLVAQFRVSSIEKLRLLPDTDDVVLGEEAARLEEEINSDRVAPTEDGMFQNTHLLTLVADLERVGPGFERSSNWKIYSLNNHVSLVNP